MTLQKRVLGVLAAAVLVVSACASNDTNLATAAGEPAVASDSSPTEVLLESPQVSAVLADCGERESTIDGEKIEEEGPAFDGGESDALDLELRFYGSPFAPGDYAEFDWSGAEGLDAVLGDDWIVECWTGEAWQSAWLAGRLFTENPQYVYLDEGWGAEDDGWGLGPGAVAIPPDAPAGTYRVTERISLFEATETGDNVGNVTVVAEFEVT